MSFQLILSGAVVDGRGKDARPQPGASGILSPNRVAVFGWG